MRNFCRDLKQQMVLDLARRAVYLFTRHCELIGRRVRNCCLGQQQTVSEEGKGDEAR